MADRGGRLQIALAPGTDDACADRVLQTQRTADGYNGLTDLGCVGVPGRHRRQAGPRDLDDGQIAHLVPPEDLDVGERRAVVEDDLARGGDVDDVVVGDDATVRGDDEPGA